MPVKKECSEGRCGNRQLLSNAAGICRNYTGSCRVFRDIAGQEDGAFGRGAGAGMFVYNYVLFSL